MCRIKNRQSKIINCLFIFVVFVFFCELAYSQQLSSKSKRAVKAFDAGSARYERGQYDEAIIELNKAIKRDAKFIEAHLLIAESWLELKNKQNAKTSFLRAIEINPDYFPPVYFSLAEIYFDSFDYEQANIYLEKFLTYSRQRPTLVERSEKLLQHSRFAAHAVQNPVPFFPENIQLEFEHDQYWPKLTVDEQTLIFTALIPKNPNMPYNRRNLSHMQEDFYLSRFQDDRWTTPVNMGAPLNTPDNEGAQTITADGNQMYFTACNRPDGMGSCDIYFSERHNGMWTRPRNLGSPVNSSAWEAQPSISADGRTLYFVSNRNGGKGGMDLWMTTRDEDGNWTNPVNLEELNTPDNESSPFIHFDGQTMYFASNGLPGMGGFDIFVTRKDSTGKWTTPANLGYPINTGHNEEGMIVSARGNRAYYSSTRDGDIRNIFTFELYPDARPSPVSYMKGKIFDERFFRSLRAHFELIDLMTSDVVIEAFSDSISGEFLVAIPSGRDYALNVKRSGYMFYSDNFTMTGGTFYEPQQKDIPLKRIRVGEKIILRNIFFDFDSDELLPQSLAELQQLLIFLRNNPTIKIAITGHTDNIGSEAYNLTLSRNRARSVVEYLINEGIVADSLSYRGLGASEPIADNETEEGRAQNRRTELLIVE